MKNVEYRPQLFLLTGLLWLGLAMAVGLILFLGMTLGRPVASGYRMFHTHGALVGGVIQIIVGLLLAGREKPGSQPALFAALNIGTLGLLIGQIYGRFLLMAIAGGLLIAVFIPLLGDIVRQIKHSPIKAPFNYWFYGVAILSLAVGLLAGEAVPLRLIPFTLTGQGRLLHLHPLIEGFVILMIVGAMHAQYPSFVHKRLYNQMLANVTYALFPLGIVILITGFVLSNIWVQIPGGLIMLVAAGLCCFNIVMTWRTAGQPSKAASDLCLVSSFFLVLAILCGILVSFNFREDPTFVPFGALHLTAYTHLALIGFVLFSLLAAVLDLLPMLLAEERVQSSKKRGPYLEALTAIVERNEQALIWTLSIGTMGLMVVAAIVWQYPLNSWPVKLTAVLSVLSLLTGLTLFSAKVWQLLATQPKD